MFCEDRKISDVRVDGDDIVVDGFKVAKLLPRSRTLPETVRGAFVDKLPKLGENGR